MIMVRQAVFILGLFCAVAHAADDEAKQLYEHGMKAYNLQDFKGALHEFQSAYVEKPDPAFLFNIGQCQRQLGEYNAAARSYRAFLNQGTASEQQRLTVEGLIKDMQVAEQLAQARKPPTGTIAPAPAIIAAVPKPWYKRPGGMVLTAGGLAVAVVGAGLLGQGAADLNNARHAATLPEQQQMQDSSNTFNTAGWVVFGVGGAALVTGVIILAAGR